MRCLFEAWAHTEAGLTFQDMAEYSNQELARLQLGFLLLRRSERDAVEGSNSAVGSQKRKLQRGHRSERKAMLEEIGLN